MNYSLKSDALINSKVYDKRTGGHACIAPPDYCNDWDAIAEIVEEYDITIGQHGDDHPFGGFYAAIEGQPISRVSHTTALRAAAICYLEMAEGYINSTGEFYVQINLYGEGREVHINLLSEKYDISCALRDEPADYRLFTMDDVDVSFNEHDMIIKTSDKQITLTERKIYIDGELLNEK